MKLPIVAVGKTFVLLLVAGLLTPVSSFAIGQESYVADSSSPGSFPVVQEKVAATIVVAAGDYAGVVRAAGDLQADVQRVSGVSPVISNSEASLGNNVILVGTLGRSPLIDRLIREKKIDVSAIAGKWESFFLQVVPKPFPGVESALVICGSDKRGTIYGIYDLSGQIGVSPWYYWADVPARHHDQLFVKAGKFVQGPPAVKYRGIFLNDEAPDLSNWIAAKYGMAPTSTNPPVPPGVANYGRGFYTNLFEVILRLRGNYLWPAMWNNAFNEDDTNNPRLADEYGVVMGNSHQEPMLRAQKEWDRRYQKTIGSWNYAKHPEIVSNFWREGIARNKHYESIITMGLRGANDTEMAPGGPEANRELLEHIVDVQRKIIADEVNPDVTQVPQLWCLYKEVMDYYIAGMRAPDDVTLLWAEDNWGNVRRLPTAEERKRSGGAGVYYHFDYHGAPRSYQWLNTTPISKIYDQMSLAKEYGADRIWIVNVGHFKGYELPLDYFMHLAWDTGRWTNDNLDEFTRLWAERQFGPEHADDIVDILNRYTKYNGRRKPELLEPGTYSLINYQEAETVVADFNDITAKAEAIFNQLPADRRDAFYQLVLFPTKASALVNELYLAAGKNALFAKQGRASANDFAVETRRLFAADTNLMAYYNQTFADGKWNHFMDQTHLGYVSWNDPPHNSLQAIKLVEPVVPEAAVMGVAVEGSTAAWPAATSAATLPAFDVFNQQKHYLDVFNQGKTPFEFTATASEPWITLDKTSGTIGKDERLWVSVDWSKAPNGTASGTVKLTGRTNAVVVQVSAFNPTEPTRDSLHGFVEGEGFVSIEAEHYTKKTDAGSNRWVKIQDYGRTLSGMRAEGPPEVLATPGKDSPRLEYQMYLFNAGEVEVESIVGPTLSFMPGRPVRYAVAFDDEAPQEITIVPKVFEGYYTNPVWSESVKNSCHKAKSTHTIKESGYHTLKIWMVDPAVVLQKIVVNTGGVKPSYLGPPESFHRDVAAQSSVK